MVAGSESRSACASWRRPLGAVPGEFLGALPLALLDFRLESPRSFQLAQVTAKVIFGFYRVVVDLESVPFGDIFDFEIVRVFEQSDVVLPLLLLAYEEFLLLPLTFSLALRGAIGTKDVL